MLCCNNYLDNLLWIQLVSSGNLVWDGQRLARGTTVRNILSETWGIKCFNKPVLTWMNHVVTENVIKTLDFEFWQLNELCSEKWWFSFKMRVTLMTLCGEEPEVTGLKIITFKCFKKKSNRQLQLPAPPVGWETLQPLSASCQDGWLEKMTVISPPCHLLRKP